MRRSVGCFRNIINNNFFIYVRPFSNAESSASNFTSRTHTCGEIRKSHVGEKVNLCGWLEFQRMDKFAILRDAYGSVQVIIPEERMDLMKRLAQSHLESVISVEGVVAQRPDNQVNKILPTGEIEIVASKYEILNNVSNTLPFTIRGHNKPKESTRLTWRYLDLRYPDMQRNLRLRSQVTHAMRTYLASQQFIDIDTPTFFKRTPGGAQEYIVPTENPGHFYALVQSPQQLKQLLMVGGVDRYYQFARCYRNEGARPDRQPEFTQLDIEMSFTDANGVMQLMEEIVEASWPTETHGPFPNLPIQRMSYQEAFLSYGSDKPDLSSPSKIETVEVNCFLEPRDYITRLLVIPKGADLLTNSIKRSFEDLKNQLHSNCRLHFLRCESQDQFKSALKKSKLPVDCDELRHLHKIQDGDLVLLVTGHDFDGVTGVLGRLRTEALSNGLLASSGGWHFLWLVDFPLFKKDENGLLKAVHHPFTQPNPDDIHFLKSDPLQVRGLHYDLILNGWEIAGGSVRIHDADLQKNVLDMLSISSSSLQHMLDALASGAPPHAGIAMGIERYISLLVKAPSIRDVIAFPKTSEGRDMMSDCPSPVSPEELELYNISVVNPRDAKAVKKPS